MQDLPLTLKQIATATFYNYECYACKLFLKSSVALETVIIRLAMCQTDIQGYSRIHDRVNYSFILVVIRTHAQTVVQLCGKLC